MTTRTPRSEPTLHLHIANWMRFGEAHGLDTCASRAKAIKVGYRHLNELEQPTPDGLSGGPVGTRFIAAIMLAFPKARLDFPYLFVPLSAAQKEDRRPAPRKLAASA